MTDEELRKELNHIRAQWEGGSGGDFHRLLFVAEQLMIAVESESAEYSELAKAARNFAVMFEVSAGTTQTGNLLYGRLMDQLDRVSGRQKRMDELGVTEQDIHETMLPPDPLTSPADSNLECPHCHGTRRIWSDFKHRWVPCTECPDDSKQNPDDPHGIYDPRPGHD